MHASVEPQDIPKKKLPPLVIILGIIFTLCAVFLLLPSSRSSKMTKAKARLATTFSGPPAKNIEFLYQEFLVSGQEKGSPGFGPSDAGFIYIFAPSPTYSGSQFFGEFSNRYAFRAKEVKSVVLWAPAPASSDWTLLAKDWISYSLLKKNVEELKALGEEISYSPSSKTTQPKLKKIWDSIPSATQVRAEEILRQNLVIAKKVGENRRFFQDGAGTVYELRPGNDTWDFTSTYQEAFPNSPLLKGD